MAVLIECPNCKVKFGIKHEECTHCRTDLKNAKKKGNVRYWIHYRVDGKQKVEPVMVRNEEGKLVPGTHKDAVDRDSERRTQKRNTPEIFEKKVEYTFQKLTDTFLEQRPIQKLAYYPTLQIKLKKFNSEYGSKNVNQIKPADLQNLQAKRKDEGLADSTVDQEIAAARAMVNWAYDNDMVGDSAVGAFRKIKKLLKRNSNARDKVLTQDEFLSLFKAAPQHTKLLLAIGCYTGMRRREILTLTWDKVNLLKREIRLEAADTKDNEARIIPILPDLHVILTAANKTRSIKNNHVILYKGEPIKDPRGGVKQACEKAGIVYGRLKEDGFTPHDLRHTFNTYMRKAGVAESVIMDITGHSTREMFDRYNTVDAEDRFQAIDKLHGFLRTNGKNEASSDNI